MTQSVIRLSPFPKNRPWTIGPSFPSTQACLTSQIIRDLGTGTAAKAEVEAEQKVEDEEGVEDLGAGGITVRKVTGLGIKRLGAQSGGM